MKLCLIKNTIIIIAPTGKLETWWRILESSHDSPMKIQLMWKVQFHEHALNCDFSNFTNTKEIALI